MRKITEVDEVLLIEMIKDGCSDSVIEDFCEKRHLHPSQAFHFIAIQKAPDCCKKCNHVDYLPDMFPCSRCCRGKNDYYEDVTSLH